MTCTICCNVHDGECSVAALKARVAGVARERDILAAALAKEQDRRTHIARIVAYREATGAGLKEAKEACEATGNEADAREPATLAAQIAWAEERCDAARKLAAAKATDVGRLTALLAAETERALAMEGERDDYRSQADAERARWRPIAERASRAEQERDTLRAQIANATRGHDTTIATLTIDAPVTIHTRDGAIRVRKLVHAGADPRIGDLAAKVRAGDGTADDLRVLCDVAERVALLEALVAERDEALAKADATIAKLNRLAHG